MKIFSCLTQNVSMILENVDTAQLRKNRANFKDKKRRAIAYERPTTPQNTRRNAWLRSCARNNDTTDLSANGSTYVPFYDGASFQCPESMYLDAMASDNEYLSCFIGTQQSAQPAATLTHFPQRPLPSPGETNHTAGGSYTDYLPLHEQHSHMHTNTDDESDISTAMYAVPRLRSNPIVQNHKASINTAGCATCSNSDIASADFSCDTDRQTCSKSCGVRISENDFASRISSVGNCNQAFTLSTGNLHPDTRNGDIISLDTVLVDNHTKDNHYNHIDFKQRQVSSSDFRFSNSHTDYTNNSVPSTFCSTVNSDFTQSSVEDHCDSVEEDDEADTEIDIETVSQSSSAAEFLGCMSFGVGHLLKKDVDGWYSLLTEQVGRNKHLQTCSRFKPVLSTRTYQNIPEINQTVGNQERVVITVTRGKNGFGFSFVDEFPPRVGRVDRASPAEHAGIKKGDLVIRINGQNVSRSTCEGVALLVRKINPQTLTLELLRDRMICTTTEITATGTLQPHHPSPYNKRGVGTSTDHLYESIIDGSSGDHHKENRIMGLVNGSYEDDYLTDDDSVVCTKNHIPKHPGVTSTPRLLAGPWQKTVGSSLSHPLSKHESIHRLMSMEFNYIDFMHYGIERYSRPLRHCILSAHQHMIIFQNVEKLVTISEYHIKQMQENNSSVNSDTDDSQSSESSMFPNSVALIYHSKIHMLGQAYETYASGLAQSSMLLRELRKNRDFMKFIREPDSMDEQCQEHPSISAFINRPILHLQELYSVLNEILSATPLHSPDFVTLQQIVIRLSQSVALITGLSTAGRVQSIDSLTSSQGQRSSQAASSEKGSLASLTSTCSSSEADVHRPLFPSTASSVRSLDKDMMRIQDMLVFAPSIQGFHLLEEGRHFIYQGDVYRSRKGVWLKSQLILFSDLLLIATEEADGSWYVAERPIGIKDLAGIEINCKYASEFVLYTHTSAKSSLQPSAYSSRDRLKKIILRAPSSQEKFMWQSLIEQRVAAFCGSKLQHFGSIKDISHAKTSIIL